MDLGGGEIVLMSFRKGLHFQDGLRVEGTDIASEDGP